MRIKQKNTNLKRNALSEKSIIVFALVFCLFGGYVIFRSFAAGPSSGDVNNDGSVNIQDLSIVLSHFGQSATAAQGDTNGDGSVTIVDLSTVLTNFGQSTTQQLPAIPSGLLATPGNSSVTLNWAANSSSDQVDTYQVYDDVNGPDNLSVSGTSFTVTGLTNGRTYMFRVSAHNSAGYSPWSAVAVSATPQSGSGGSSGVTPPAAPASYTLPTGAVTVSTSAALQTALNGSTTDIILADGSYTNNAYMTIGSHRLWSQNLGGATLHFGLVMGGNSGSGDPEIHGLKFNVNDNSLGLEGSIIDIWGAGQNAVIDDSWFEGNSVMAAAIMSRVTSGFTVHRVVANDFLKWGIFFETYFVDSYTDSPAIEPVVSDININNVQEPTPGSDDGTAEAGLWAGTGCLCSNIKIRNTGWMGIWTGGNANNGVYSNFDIDQVGSDSVGVYLEHYSRGNTFTNFIIGSSPSGSGVRAGFNCEWADTDPLYANSNPVPGQSIAACHFNTFKNGTIYSHDIGFELQDAEGTTIQNMKFIGQSFAGIDDFMTAGSGWTTTWQSQGNDFSGILLGSTQYTNLYPQ